MRKSERFSGGVLRIYRNFIKCTHENAYMYFTEILKQYKIKGNDCTNRRK